MRRIGEYKVNDPKPNIENWNNLIKDLYVCKMCYQRHERDPEDIEASCTQIQIYKELDETYQRLTKLLKLTNKKIGE